MQKKLEEVFHCLAVFATHGDPVLAVQGAGKQGERPLSARHIVHTPGSQCLRYRHIVRKPVSHSICKKTSLPSGRVLNPPK